MTVIERRATPPLTADPYGAAVVVPVLDGTVTVRGGAVTVSGGCVTVVVVCVSVGPVRCTLVVFTDWVRLITVCVSLVFESCTTTASSAPRTSTMAAPRIQGPTWEWCAGGGAPDSPPATSVGGSESCGGSADTHGTLSGRRRDVITQSG